MNSLIKKTQLPVERINFKLKLIKHNFEWRGKSLDEDYRDFILRKEWCLSQTEIDEMSEEKINMIRSIIIIEQKVQNKREMREKQKMKYKK